MAVDRALRAHSKAAFQRNDSRLGRFASRPCPVDTRENAPLLGREEDQQPRGLARRTSSVDTVTSPGYLEANQHRTNGT